MALSGITSGISTATSLANLIVVTANTIVGYQPQTGSSLLGATKLSVAGIPIVQPPPPSLVFHYEGEQTVTLESDITDHYVEDNTAVQDQIALRPELITTHGFIGELNDIPPNIVLAGLQSAANAFTTISAYTPALSVTAQLAYTEASFLYSTAINAINSAVSAWSSIGSLVSGTSGSTTLNQSDLINTSGLQSQQQIYFQQFYAYWKNRVLFTVQTPWGVFSDCAIKTLRAIQDAETNVITDFEVTFKVINFYQTIIAPGSIARNATQGAAGVTSTTTAQSSISLSSALATV